MNRDITQQELHELFEYRDDGNLYWKVSKSKRVHVGDLAGTIVRKRCGPYRYVRLFGKSYGVHRLIWLYHYNAWPLSLIDHRDRDGLNNKITNLREASNSENQQNKIVNKNNKLGVKGVTYIKSRKKYRARIHLDNRQKILGYYVTVEEASQAYHLAAQQFHGDFYLKHK